ncbi:hypothetical protein EYF80_012692 [Liparis tanakae]|uniref:Uncharacterized protein n=1 Tax=Liparis tanakae TaxID=230148 RepID=A0A4Z2IHX4_9TELE|nr:hypothetical protein EYF80_012692 [Liparis tanakae]
MELLVDVLVKGSECAPRMQQACLSAPLGGHHALVLHVTLVPHQEDLGIVPRMVFTLKSMPTVLTKAGVKESSA